MCRSLPGTAWQLQMVHTWRTLTHPSALQPSSSNANKVEVESMAPSGRGTIGLARHSPDSSQRKAGTRITGGQGGYFFGLLDGSPDCGKSSSDYDTIPI